MARFVPDDSGFTRLATGRDMERLMHRVGEHWKNRLIEIAPRGTRERGGHYVDNIAVVDVTEVVNGAPRAAVRVVARSRYAAALEYGTAQMTNPPRPLHQLADEMRQADPRNR